MILSRWFAVAGPAVVVGGGADAIGVFRVILQASQKH
jgi:hypothetical protein